MQSPADPEPTSAPLPWRHYPHAARFVAAGGGAGATARWALIDGAGTRWGPWTEAGSAVVGALVVGLLIGLRLTRAGERRITSNQYLLLGSGFFAAFAAFPAYALRVAAALDQGALLEALQVGLGTPAAAVVAAGIGYRLGSRR